MDIEIVNEAEQKKLREPNGKMVRVFQKFIKTGAKMCKLTDLPKDKTVESVYKDVYRRAWYMRDKYPTEYPIVVKRKDGIIYLVRTDIS